MPSSLTAADYRADFPLLQKIKGGNFAYLDNGATTQKPQAVIDAINNYYLAANANPHRGAYALSVAATDIYENCRERVKSFLNAKHSREIIFTCNTTESLNLVAYSYALHNLKPDDEILISIAEHHSNLVPWQMAAKATGAKLRYIYLEDDGNFSEKDIAEKINEKTKIVAITQVSNVLGLINDVAAIAKKAHAVGAVVVVDGAQSTPHLKVDVQALDADFFAFSGHKMLAPMNIGVLYGKEKLLEKMPPFLRGGDMIEYVAEQETDFAELPAKFEAGTQNVEGAAGLHTAIDYIEKAGFDFIAANERELVSYLLPQLKEMNFIELYGCETKRDNKTGIVTFNVKDVHPHDVATILDSCGVAIRAGHHCAQPLMNYLGQNATCRASFYFYNTKEDVDKLVAGLQQVRKVMRLE